MTAIIRYSIVFMFGLMIFGCSKDSTTSPTSSGATNSTLVGNWQVLSGVSGAKYLAYHADNVYYYLNQYGNGLRGIDGGVAQVSDNTINIAQTIYNFSVKGDTLFFSSPSQTVTLLRSTTAPSDSQWVKTVNVLDTLTPPIPEATDMAINGNIMWYGNAYSSHNLYKINLTTRAVDTLPTTNYAWAVEWDGTNLWTSSDGSTTIYKVNPTTGANISTSVDMGAWIYGIAWDGVSLWCSSWNEETMYRYDPATNTVLNTYPLGRNVEIGGLAYVAGSLYVCAHGVINKCTASPFATVSAYQIAGYYAAGIAYDGTNFWVSTYQGNKYMVFKVALQ